MPKIIIDNEVFHAVMEVMVKNGYAGTTTKQMAQAAGMSEVSLFRKYGSKANLVKLATASIVQELDLGSVSLYTGNPETDFLRITESYQNLAVRYGNFMVMLLPELMRHSELAEVLDRPVGIMHNIINLILQYQEKGILQPENPYHVLSTLLGPLMYITFMGGTFFKPNLPPLDLQQHIQNFLRGWQYGDVEEKSH